MQYQVCLQLCIDLILSLQPAGTLTHASSSHKQAYRNRSRQCHETVPSSSTYILTFGDSPTWDCLTRFPLLHSTFLNSSCGARWQTSAAQQACWGCSRNGYWHLVLFSLGGEIWLKTMGYNLLKWKKNKQQQLNCCSDVQWIFTLMQWLTATYTPQNIQFTCTEEPWWYSTHVPSSLPFHIIFHKTLK